MKKAVELSHGSTISLAVLGHAYASAGKGADARAILSQLQDRSRSTYLPSYWVALVYTGLGEEDQALTWLERAAEERSSWVVWIKVEPRFDRLRGLPRFQTLLKRMGFPAAGLQDRSIVELLYGLSDLDLTRYTVTGAYTRYEERARHLLKDLFQTIARGLDAGPGGHESLLLWAPPGSGKTFLVRESARASSPSTRYFEINLAEDAESTFRQKLLDAGRHPGPALILIDEVDSRPGEAWPYEALLPHLERRGGDRPARVFVLAGSAGAHLEEMESRIRGRPKGPDLLSRIPESNRRTIPAVTAMDRILVALANLQPTDRTRRLEFTEIEKLALYYVAVSPALESPRQLREFMIRCADRVPPRERRVRFDHLFDVGDAQSKEFWVQARRSTPELIDRFVRLSGVKTAN